MLYIFACDASIYTFMCKIIWMLIWCNEVAFTNGLDRGHGQCQGCSWDYPTNKLNGTLIIKIKKNC